MFNPTHRYHYGDTSTMHYNHHTYVLHTAKPVGGDSGKGFPAKHRP